MEGILLTAKDPVDKHLLLSFVGAFKDQLSVCRHKSSVLFSMPNSLWTASSHYFLSASAATTAVPGTSPLTPNSFVLSAQQQQQQQQQHVWQQSDINPSQLQMQMQQGITSQQQHVGPAVTVNPQRRLSRGI